MAAGVKYSLTPLAVEPENCRIETIVRGTGGFNLSLTNLTVGEFLPPLAPLAINLTTRSAVAVKNVKVYENALANATAIKVVKGSLAYTGMFLGNGSNAAEVTAVDKTNALYDALTITLGAAVTAGDILMEVAGASSVVNAVKGIYTLTIGTVPVADDKLSINGIEYTFAAAAAEGKIMIGANAIATAANLQDTVEADNQNFVVKANGAKLVFTQKVAGTGAIPAIVVTQTGGGTLAASIAETTAGVAGVVNAVTEPLNVANFLNYARTKIELGATITNILAVHEIQESKLELPISAKDKVNFRANGGLYTFVA